MKKHQTHRLTAALSAAAMAVSVLSTLPMPTVNAATLSGKDAKGIVSQMKIGEDPEQAEQAQYIADPPSVYHASGPEGPATADSPDVPGRAAAVTFPVTPAG